MFFSQIEKAKEELLVSDVFHSIIASLREGLTLLEEPNLHEIICLGLGKVAWFVRCKYQLAFLLCLRDIYEIEVKVFDPVFIEDDHFILNHFNITVLTENLEGKYKTDKNSTIFFLPHCSQQLSNNIIWANWGVNLRHCILICNSFSSMIENTPKSFWAEYEHIINIYSHVVELAIANTFKYYDIFNDTSIHVFPPSKLKLLPTYSEKMSTIRQIISELRKVVPKENMKNNLALRYIVNQYKKYQTTDQQLCKAKEEMDFMAKTYLCYLQSSRLCQEIHDEFHSKGERTVEETAKMVGFKLPHDPK
ncbi:hypothetical protein HHI36_012555 [Cryptolaemus montrouzieri]|uniref:SRR1-like domain-containing protein n=1 Tax=Cryptolaemus montrouzieri TaxID=559131 RepID=A0ABD2NFP6_9CUCU